MNNGWKEYCLEDLLSYEQPTPYIVESTEYSDAFETPVLTAGASFILGYTDEAEGIYDQIPVIIFDDFTTASKYVNFPFKVKSSAMKILSANKELVLPKFIYYRMQTIKFEHSTHKRYWIQQYSKIKVKIPSLKEQKRIVNKIEELFSELDSAVETLKRTKEQLAVYRQSVMKEAFESLDHPHNMLFDSLLENMRNGYGKKPDDAGSFKILRISSVRPMAVVLDDFRLNKTSFSADDLIQENDLLFTRYNGSKELVGVCASVPHLDCDYAYPDKIIRCRLKDGNVVLSKYLQYYFNQGNALKSIRKMIKTTSGQNGIAGSDLKKLNVLMVNPEMQRKVVDFIEQKISLSNKIEKTVNNALIQADAMRQSILKKAFEGGL
jgi:type I restriction enzyme S subunit